MEDDDQADGHGKVGQEGEHGHVLQVFYEGQQDEEGQEEEHVDTQIQAPGFQSRAQTGLRGDIGKRGLMICAVLPVPFNHLQGAGIHD